jgi:hypothetical protein
MREPCLTLETVSSQFTDESFSKWEKWVLGQIVDTSNRLVLAEK